MRWIVKSDCEEKESDWTRLVRHHEDHISVANSLRAAAAATAERNQKGTASRRPTKAVEGMQIPNQSRYRSTGLPKKKERRDVTGRENIIHFLDATTPFLLSIHLCPVIKSRKKKRGKKMAIPLSLSFPLQPPTFT